VQQFRADIDDDFSWNVTTAAMAMMCTSQLSCQIVLRFDYPRSGFSTDRQFAQRQWTASHKAEKTHGFSEKCPRILMRFAHQVKVFSPSRPQ
jgi:hypothetical protein